MNAQNAIRPLHAELPKPVQSAIDSHRVVLVVSPITDTGLITRWLSQHGEDYTRLELSMRSPRSRAEFDQLRHATRWRSLPQIFIDGRFIGGTEEFFERMAPAAASRPGADGHSAWARWLGYGGLIPFFALALISLLGAGSLSAWATQALIGYGAVILSFVGALHWTRGLGAGDSAVAGRLLTLSVLPALLGWVALLLPAHLGLVLLTASFGLIYAYDRQAWRMWPRFLSLRSHLTAGAMGSLLLVWLGSAA